jgi:oligoendopeptidase F
MKTPAWNNDTEYTSLQSEAFKKDWSFVEAFQLKMKAEAESLKPLMANPMPEVIHRLQEIFKSEEAYEKVLHNLYAFISTLTSVDGSDQEASKKNSEIQKLVSESTQVLLPFEMFIKTCNPEIIELLLKDETLKNSRFVWERMRSRTPYLLSESDEVLLQAMSVPGFQAWGNLYNDLSSKIKCHLKYEDRTEVVGLAQAHSFTRLADEKIRKVAWTAIQEAWTEHSETSAAILNALTGWRLEVYEKRSHTKKLHYLDEALFKNRISQETLDAMIGACESNLSRIHKAPKLMARILGKDRIDPWDLLAPGPAKGGEELSFDKGLALVRDSFAEVSPEMASFVDMMMEKQWIEARVMPNKRTGAFCMGFAKSRTPRVFMTYMGSGSDVSTLAHELGHGFHSWVMRDMAPALTYFPSTLAETASVFAETVLHDALVEKAKTPAEKLTYAWAEIEGATSFLINIPMRLDFERNFYEARKKGKVSVNELNELMNASWKRWYGNTISQNDRLFWAHKLHFSMTKTTFYNFPYTFGYLFSLSIYARREQLGDKFMKTYVDILRDTGSMNAEELVQKHLGEDITKPAFWQKAIDVVLSKVESFESLV